MFNRRCYACFGLAVLSFTGTVATAGSINYEGLEGARCHVTTESTSGFEVETSNIGGDAAVTARVRIPFADTTRSARQNCVRFAEQDQARQHFTWLLDMYQNGVITRKALQDEADKLGITLAPEVALPSESVGVTIP